MKAKAMNPDTKTAEDKAEDDLAALEEELAGPLYIEPSVLMIKRMYKEEGILVTDPEEEVEEVAVREFAVEPARAGLRSGVTMNMGNFWSAVVQVEFSVPCYREEHAEAFAFVEKTIEERMQANIERAQERVAELKGGNGGGQGHPF